MLNLELQQMFRFFVPKGKNPSATPATVVTPATMTLVLLTAVTFANVLVFFPSPPNFKMLPTFTFPKLFTSTC